MRPALRATPALAALALRRSLPAPLVALALLLLGLACAGGGALAESDSPLSRALARHEVWALLAWVLLPLQVWCAANLPRRWREGECDLHAPRACSRAQLLIASWLGASLGAALVVALGLGAAELAAGGTSQESRRVLQRPPCAGGVLEPGAPALVLPLVSREQDARSLQTLRLELLSAPAGGRSCELRYRIGGEGQEWQSYSFRGRGELDLAYGGAEAPRSSTLGPLHLELACTEGGPPAVLVPQSLVLFGAAGSERAASLALGLHCWLLACAAIALALGVATWFHASTAWFAVVALWTGLWSLSYSSSIVPGWMLPIELDTLARGFTPPLPGLAEPIGCGLLVACGLGLARLGLQRWRRF